MTTPLPSTVETALKLLRITARIHGRPLSQTEDEMQRFAYQAIRERDDLQRKMQEKSRERVKAIAEQGDRP